MRERRSIGPWLVYEKLGTGGNATVYRAERPGDPDVALKVLNTTNVSREPYRRFVQEVGTLVKLGAYPGVLRLIDSYLPQTPSREDPAWLAMPRAIVINVALESQPLEVVVEALRSIADTLARLAAEHDLGHRDVKPPNLYERDGEWLVGDFGLVAAPDLDELTRTNRPLGPAHFTAYEMIRDPTSADPHPADVFSLGKTLWVLATEQRFPPPGHQPAGRPELSVADLRPHPHAAALDRLVDGMTTDDPRARPTKAQVVTDLDAWLQLTAELVRVDVVDARTRLRTKLAKQLSREELEETWKEQAYATVRHLQQLTEPINEALKEVHPRAEVDVMAEEYVRNMLRARQFDQTQGALFTWQRQSQIALGHTHRPWVIRIGRGIELSADGAVTFRALIDVGFTTVMGGPRFDWQTGARSAPVGSIELDRVLEQAIAEVVEQLPAALDVFIEHVSDSSA